MRKKRRRTKRSERLDMILAGPHGYPTEKVLNTGNKIGGKAYNSTANKKGARTTAMLPRGG